MIMIQSYMIPVACFICFVTCLILFFPFFFFCMMINEKLSSKYREKVELENLYIGIVVLNLLLLNKNLMFYWKSWWWGRWWHWWRSWWWGKGWFRWARWGWNWCNEKCCGWISDYRSLNNILCLDLDIYSFLLHCWKIFFEDLDWILFFMLKQILMKIVYFHVEVDSYENCLFHVFSISLISVTCDFIWIIYDSQNNHIWFIMNHVYGWAFWPESRNRTGIVLKRYRSDEAKNVPLLGGHLSRNWNLFDQILP
jgi:hypothetical protein